MSSQDELQRKLSDAGLAAFAQPITQLARPCLRVLRAVVPEDQVLPGASKFGGSPDVPANFVWPESAGGKKPEPMEFVAQVRLSDLPKPFPETLPASGLLSFFNHWKGGRIFYFSEETRLQRTQAPFARVEPAPSGFWNTLRSGLGLAASPRRIYRSASLRFEPALSPADGNSSMSEQLHLSESDSETYMELCEEWRGGGLADDVRHQMFGHADPIQGEMELGCDFQRLGQEERWDSPRERYLAAARNWVLLLQVDSDDGENGPGWMWGDGGKVYFWIHRDDLAAGAFNRAIAIEQCY
jgi:uncharacterized protein YwqG